MTSFKVGIIGYVALLLGLFVLLFTLSGCTLMQAKSYNQMTPDEMKVLSDMHIDVYSCITVAGPPPSGKFVYVLVPRLDKKPDVRFGENCAIK